MSTEVLHLERMTWPEIEAALARGMTTAVIPCGAVEQHGPHLPLFTDAEHGTRLGEEVARRLGNALVAPTIRVGCSAHHLAFPGTLSFRESTFRAVCQDYCTSLAHHGFQRICLLPSHGGNCRPLADMVPDLTEQVGPTCRVVAFTDLLGMIEVWKRVVDEEGSLGDRVGGHADIAESSVMLCLHPELVHEEAAAEGHPPDLSAAFIDRLLREGLRSITPNGILGDARGMSPQIGLRCIETMADLMTEYFHRAMES